MGPAISQQIEVAIRLSTCLLTFLTILKFNFRFKHVFVSHVLRIYFARSIYLFPDSYVKASLVTCDYLPLSIYSTREINALEISNSSIEKQMQQTSEELSEGWQEREKHQVRNWQLLAHQYTRNRAWK